MMFTEVPVRKNTKLHIYYIYTCHVSSNHILTEYRFMYLMSFHPWLSHPILSYIHFLHIFISSVASTINGYPNLCQLFRRCIRPSSAASPKIYTKCEAHGFEVPKKNHSSHQDHSRKWFQISKGNISHLAIFIHFQLKPYGLMQKKCSETTRPFRIMNKLSFKFLIPSCLSKPLIVVIH